MGALGSPNRLGRSSRYEQARVGHERGIRQDRQQCPQQQEKEEEVASSHCDVIVHFGIFILLVVQRKKRRPNASRHHKEEAEVAAEEAQVEAPRRLAQRKRRQNDVTRPFLPGCRRHQQVQRDAGGGCQATRRAGAGARRERGQSAASVRRMQEPLDGGARLRRRPIERQLASRHGRPASIVASSL